jgi:hypothetical protein
MEAEAKYTQTISLNGGQKLLTYNLTEYINHYIPTKTANLKETLDNLKVLAQRVNRSTPELTPVCMPG